MTRKDISYELFINKKTRYKNFISYMNLSKDYSKKEVDDLYKSDNNRETSIPYLLGILLLNDLKKLGNQNLIETSKKESEFRNLLEKSMNSNKSNKIKEIFKKNNISLENIKFQINSKDFINFSPKRFLRLIIQKSDLKIVQFFNKKKILNQKEMREFIDS